MTNAMLIGIIIAILVIAIGAWAVLRTRNTKRLRTRFGPEYDHLIQREGDRTRAEAELAQREKRVKKLHIRDLTPEERRRFADAWRERQSMFVEDPHTAVAEADVLVTEAMKARGYPTTNFETQLADVSVDHSRVVENYREAHRIAEMGRQASTEDLRRAMICYRDLFEDFIGTRVVNPAHEEVQK